MGLSAEPQLSVHRDTRSPVRLSRGGDLLCLSDSAASPALASGFVEYIITYSYLADLVQYDYV